MALRVGDEIEVEWLIGKTPYWWRARVMKVSKKRCTLAYEPFYPDFPQGLIEEHILGMEGRELIQKGTYCVLRHRPYRERTMQELLDELSAILSIPPGQFKYSAHAAHIAIS